MDHRIHQLQPHPLIPKVNKHVQSHKSDGKTFESYLNEAKSKTSLTVSKHAQLRLNERNIEIKESDWSKIQSKMEQAKAKGVTDSLVIMDDALLVVSTKNNTVITAMNKQEATDHIFTNINGTILMDN
ncbi:TIGR02530 family flagellar biosynthesis protein [Salirhabdus sp. Marseille-P4669]|uniref:TIGR02530 family flagellar biosynthesis protein n=1 Tax=Salirhabdus sp. Marseille-P4669 TaxID=2042310 RepID=UPI000C7B3A54|nr:TIGR02530 family flagellar biosynthesis protein [Salirhabdus sp. Marseille-P4669]